MLGVLVLSLVELVLVVLVLVVVLWRRGCVMDTSAVHPNRRASSVSALPTEFALSRASTGNQAKGVRLRTRCPTPRSTVGHVARDTAEADPNGNTWVSRRSYKEQHHAPQECERTVIPAAHLHHPRTTIHDRRWIPIS